MLLSLGPFPLSQALPWAFEYYEPSVALSLSAGRRSRISVQETLSPRRCPSVSLPDLTDPCPSERAFRVPHLQTRILMASPQGCCDEGTIAPLETSGLIVPNLTLRTGLAELPLHPFTALRFQTMLLSPQGFPLRLGRVLEVFCSQPLLSFEKNLLCGETAHGSVISFDNR
jgi:hypothetical protein